MRRWESGLPPKDYAPIYRRLAKGAETFSPRFSFALYQSLEEVLAGTRVKAGIARELRDERIAAVMEDVVAMVEEATRDYRTFLPEADAIVWSGRSRAWLRRRYRELATDGNAKLSETGVRTFRRIALPRRRGHTGLEDAADRIASSKRRTRHG